MKIHAFLLPFLFTAAFFPAGCRPGERADLPGTLQVSCTTEREAIGGEPGRPFSPAVRVTRTCTRDGVAEIMGETLYVSGQVGTDPGSGERVSGGIKAETVQVLENLQRVVESAGFSLSDAVRCTVYLVDMGDYDAMNEAYLEFFPESPPSRACVGVRELVRDFQVEISLVAEK